jgi:hypothetical protein
MTAYFSMLGWAAAGYGVRCGQWVLLKAGTMLAWGYNRLDRQRQPIATRFGAAETRFNRWHAERTAR